MEQEEITRVLQRINEAWIMGYADQIPRAMDDCFDDRMVIKGSDFQTLGTGKAACIQSYVDFVNSARIKGCTLSTPHVEVTGDTAVATYSWQLTYDQNGKEHKDSGNDLFVFARADGRWHAVCRVMIPAAAQ